MDFDEALASCRCCQETWFLPFDDAGMRFDRAWAHAGDLHTNGLISDATKSRLLLTLSDELEEAGHGGGAPETIAA